MDMEKFKQALETNINKLNKKQAVYFAWRCSVRVLPFLGSIGCFSFWEEEEARKDLYTIFFSLDLTVLYSVEHDALHLDNLNNDTSASYAWRVA